MKSSYQHADILLMDNGRLWVLEHKEGYRLFMAMLQAFFQFTVFKKLILTIFASILITFTD